MLGNLADQFVTVRMVKCNDLDLGLFQFDHDLTFAVFFMTPDGTMLARYGSRHGMESADEDVSVEGLRETMQAALELFQNYPGNRAALSGLQPHPTDIRKPQQMKPLADYPDTLDYEGATARSCIHCHQLTDARRRILRETGQPFTDQDLFPYPAPSSIGVELDPKTRATVKRVLRDSPAARAGLRPGDEIQSINETPVSSPADLQWILHHWRDGDKLVVAVPRRTPPIEIQLPDGWRASTDISWRPTTWDLRRMATGGLTLVPAPPAIRNRLQLNDRQMALRVDHVGQFGDHARGKRAGFRKGDVIVSFAGRDDLVSESRLIAWAIRHTRPGETIKVDVWRQGERKTFELEMH